MDFKTILNKTGSYIWKLVPRDVRISAAKKRCEQHCKPSVLEFPWNNQAIHSILVMLPDTPGEALYQAETCAALPKLFPNAALSFFCTNAVASWFQLLHPKASFIQYSPALPTFFSQKLDTWGDQLRDDAFDVCLLLNCDADAEQLYLAGRSVAGIRAGYGGADDGVLLNLHIKPLDSHTFLADRNFAMARIFGAENKAPVQWSLSSAVMGEVSRMMPECTSETKTVVGIDIGSLFPLCGAEWCNRLCRALNTEASYCCYIYCAETPSTPIIRFTEEFRCRFFQKIEPARTSALIAQSRCFVTADTVLFRTGNLIGNAIVGLFPQSDIACYCVESKTARGIGWTGKPSDIPVDTVVQAVLSAVGKGSGT